MNVKVPALDEYVIASLAFAIGAEGQVAEPGLGREATVGSGDKRAVEIGPRRPLWTRAGPTVDAASMVSSGRLLVANDAVLAPLSPSTIAELSPGSGVVSLYASTASASAFVSPSNRA